MTTPARTGKRAITGEMLLDCLDCTRHVEAPENQFLLASCASVGIEHGKSTARMYFEYLAGFHARGHRSAG